MSQKRKRAWSLLEEPRWRPRFSKEEEEIQKKREEYKIGRIKKIPDDDFSQDGLEELREQYYCKKTHPGRYCRDCNPRAWQKEDNDNPSEEDKDSLSEENNNNLSEEDNDSLSEEDNNSLSEEDNNSLSEEEAVLSDTWSNKSHTLSDHPSPTYTDLWQQEFEDRKAIKHLKTNIAFVDAAASELKALIINRRPLKIPTGSLRGDWDLYNLDICKKVFQYCEFYRLTIFGPTLDGQPPGWESMKDLGFEIFMELSIKDAGGSVVPFQLPANASLDPIPILLEENSTTFPAAITFLGKDCLRISVPRSVVFGNEAEVVGNPAEMLEFAGRKINRSRITSIDKKIDHTEPKFDSSGSSEKGGDTK